MSCADGSYLNLADSPLIEISACSSSLYLLNWQSSHIYAVLSHNNPADSSTAAGGGATKEARAGREARTKEAEASSEAARKAGKNFEEARATSAEAAAGCITLNFPCC